VAFVLALSLSACVETEMTLAPDDSVSGTLSWDAGPVDTEEKARKLLTADGVTVKKIEFKDAERTVGGKTKKVRRATAEIAAKKVAQLAAIPLFEPLAVQIALGKPADGKRTLTVSATDKTTAKNATDPTDNVVRVTLPGAVSDTSAKAEGNTVTWKFSSEEYFAKDKVEMRATYAVPEKPAAE